MKLPANGKTKAAIISAAGALVVASIALASWYGGWKSKIGAEYNREQRVTDLLTTAEHMSAEVAATKSQAVENAVKVNGLSARVDNLDDNVRTLIETQTRTNEKLERLTQTLMDYLAAQARRRPAP